MMPPTHGHADTGPVFEPGGPAGVLLEIAFTLLLVLLCAVALWTLTQRFLPAGISFGDLVARNDYLESDMRDRLFGNTLASEDAPLPGERPVLARLTAVDNRVKIKPRNDIAWSDAAEGRRLWLQDAIQTFGNSRAQIVFAESGRIHLDQNSLVVLRGLRRRESASRAREIVMEIDGRFNGRITRTMDRRESLKVVLPHAVMKARAIDGPTVDLNVTVDADNNSRVAVYQGTARITTQSEEIYIDRDNAVSIDARTGRTESVRLASSLKLTNPAPGAVVYYRDSPRPVTFSWSGSDPDARYRLEIARDERFADIVFDRPISGGRFVHGSLEAGRYHWRVTGVRDDGRGRQSEVRDFEVVQDNVKPALSVDPPPAVVDRETLTVTGTTEPEASLFIDGDRVDVDARGRFSETVDLQPGTQVIVVESVDAAGNTAYASHTVTRKQ